MYNFYGKENYTNNILQSHNFTIKEQNDTEDLTIR